MKSMAMAYSGHPCVTLQKSVHIASSARKILMVQQRQVQVKRVVKQAQLIRSSPKNMVWEDESQGIICYTDDNGDIVCEGYDEGPRFQPHNSKTAYDSSMDAVNIDLLSTQLSSTFRCPERSEKESCFTRTSDDDQVEDAQHLLTDTLP